MDIHFPFFFHHHLCFSFKHQVPLVVYQSFHVFGPPINESLEEANQDVYCGEYDLRTLSSTSRHEANQCYFFAKSESSCYQSFHRRGRKNFDIEQMRGDVRWPIEELFDDFFPSLFSYNPSQTTSFATPIFILAATSAAFS